jgi:hypothetical protein
MTARILSAFRWTLMAWFSMGAVLFAGSGRPIDIPERIHGADRVVVASAASVTPTWRSNVYGDQLIVSQVLLQVEETLKGDPQGSVLLALEGGTLGGVTLTVSSLPDVKPGERAVFFLDRAGNNEHVPHLKGLGILKLDQTNQVQGSSLQLEDIRRMAAQDK